MLHKIKTEIQIFFVLIMITVFIMLLTVTGGHEAQLTTAAAQGPIRNTPPPAFMGEDSLAAFGLSRDEIQVSGQTFDLEVDIAASSIKATSGQTIQVNVSIKNLGPNPASYILFFNNYPAQMSNVTYQFGGTQAISDGLAKPTWLLPGPFNSGATVSVTVSGRVDATCNIVVPNVAQVSTFINGADSNSTNDVDSVDLDITGTGNCTSTSVYFPFVRRDPTPTPLPIVFFDDFSNDKSGWPEVEDGDCDSEYRNNEYRVDVRKNEACFRPAPGGAERQFGEFQVAARRSGGDDEYGYGIYINGKGGDNYYLFRIWPNDECRWEFRKRQPGSNTILSQGGCDPAINRGSATNVLKIRHTGNGELSVFVNNSILITVIDNSQLTGEGTGIYAEADDDTALTSQFDNFTVFQP